MSIWRRRKDERLAEAYRMVGRLLRLCTDLIAKTERLQEAVRQETYDGDDLRRRLAMYIDKAEGQYWVWQGDGEDHPDSLTCPVLVPAEQVREWIFHQQEHEKAEAACAAVAGYVADDEECERCDDCGRRYLGVYGVSDATWHKLTGRSDGSGLLCICCAAARAREVGLVLHWDGQTEAEAEDRCQAIHRLHAEKAKGAMPEPTALRGLQSR